MNRPYRLVVGIDPDAVKSGCAVVNNTDKTIETHSMTFFELFEFVEKFKSDKSVLIKIECGFLNKKSSWHKAPSVNVATNIAKKVGQNHQTAKLIVEMCEFLDVPYMEKMPLKKIWKGADKKITQEELEQQVSRLGYTYKGKKNQDARDATLIALY